MDQEDFSQITIYSNSNEFEPIHLKFYHGTNPRDVHQFILDTIDNLKTFTKNSKLRAFIRSTATELDHHARLSDVSSLILAEDNPPNPSPSSKFPHTAIPDLSQPHANGFRSTAAFPETYRSGEKFAGAYNGKLTEPVAEKIVIEQIINPQSPMKPGAKARPFSAVTSLAAYKVGDRSRRLSPRKDQMSARLTFNPSANENGIISSSPERERQSGPGAPTGKFPIGSGAKWKTGEVALVPIDGNDVLIYSARTNITPFSYVRYTELEKGGKDGKYNAKLPPPIYLKYEIVSQKKDYSKSSVFSGLEILPSGELKLVDKEILKKQSGIVSDVLKRLASSIAEGRGVVGVSLPVRIFEPRSLLERICDWWTFIPNYLIPAIEFKNPLDRMKAVITMAVAGMYVSAKQVKPFNPLLGETFQATFPGKNITIDVEHTSHHPPIANFLVEHPGFKFWGRYIFQANLDMNTLTLHQEGPNHVDFRDGQRITFYWTPMKIGGMLWGDRTCKYSGIMKFVDEKNRVKAVLKMNDPGEFKKYSKKRTDAFHGKIYTYDPDNEKEHKNKKKADEYDGKFTDLIEPICNIYGSWLESLFIDEKEVWNIDKEIPSNYVAIENPLCSDCRFREDLLWVKRDNFKFAEEWKLKLEERQRAERKLRQDFAKNQAKEMKKKATGK